MKKICFIVGMGRSGTSMLANLIEIFGIDFGKNCHGGNEYNPKGYFENAFIVDINDAILKILRGNRKCPVWAMKGALPTEWLHPSIISSDNINQIYDKCSTKIKEVINRDLGQFEFAGIKDPRVTLFIPIYKKICEDLKIKPYFIHIERNPLEVAKSLYKFHDLRTPKQNAIDLCKRYNNDAEKFLGTEKIKVKYNQIISEPIKISKQICNHLDIKYDLDFGAKILKTIDAKLYRNKA